MTNPDQPAGEVSELVVGGSDQHPDSEKATATTALWWYEKGEAAGRREATEYWAKRCLEYAEGAFSPLVKGVYISLANELTETLERLKAEMEEQDGISGPRADGQ